MKAQLVWCWVVMCLVQQSRPELGAHTGMARRQSVHWQTACYCRCYKCLCTICCKSCSRIGGLCWRWSPFWAEDDTAATSCSKADWFNWSRSGDIWECWIQQIRLILKINRSDIQNQWYDLVLPSLAATPRLLTLTAVGGSFGSHGCRPFNFARSKNWCRFRIYSGTMAYQGMISNLIFYLILMAGRYETFMRFYDLLGHAPPNFYRMILLFVNSFGGKSILCVSEGTFTSYLPPEST